MKTKHIIAIGTLGFTAGIGISCIAQISVPQPPVAPMAPSTYVWDGSEYVGEVDGKYYYLDTNASPSATWSALDQTRQQRFEAYTNSAGNNPSQQSSQTGNANSQAPAKGQNAGEQSGQIQNNGQWGPAMGPGPGGQSNQTGNTNSQGPAKGH